MMLDGSPALRSVSAAPAQPATGARDAIGGLILSRVSDDEVEAARLRRELADAKVEQLQARLAEITSIRSLPDLPLSMPPRQVPVGYRMFVLPWSTWTVFTLVMIAAAPIALWIFWPVVGLVVTVVVLLAVVVLAIRKYAKLISLLRWGLPASATTAEPLDIGTYFSGTTYNNVRLPIAHGWKVTRSFYSGPGVKTRVRYQLNDATGAITLRGREYIDGVILVDSRRPKVAACVTSIPFDLSERTPSGDWTGRIRTGTVVGAIAMLVFVVGWAAGMLLLCGLRAESLDQLPFLG